MRASHIILLVVARKGYGKGSRKHSPRNVHAEVTHDSVAIPDGMQPLPYALAAPGALQALQWLAQSVEKGMAS